MDVTEMGRENGNADIEVWVGGWRERGERGEEEERLTDQVNGWSWNSQGPGSWLVLLQYQRGRISKEDVWGWHKERFKTKR